MGETKTIYVLMVTTMRTQMPNLMPATFEGVIKASCEFEYFPAAASFDAEPLEHKGRTMKERFPTVESWEVIKVPFMERGRMMERVIDTSTMEVDRRGEVVRCRDCRHCAMVGEERVCQRLPFRFKVGAECFCSWGERRDR